MAYTTTTSLPLKMPVPGSREPAQIALLNENAVAVDAHDHTTGKGVAIGRMRSGLEANRPAAGQAGNVYFATDTGKFYVDSGAAWVEFLTTGGTSTITGWTLVDPIVRDRIFFGPEPTGTPDANIWRAPPGTSGVGSLMVGARLGVGVSPSVEWHANRHAIVQVGPTAVLAADSTTEYAELASNSILNTANEQRSINNAPATRVVLTGGGLSILTAPTVAAEAAQTFTTRAQIGPTGTLTLTPDASVNGLLINNPAPTGDVALHVFSRAGTERWSWALDNNNDLQLINAAFAYKHKFRQTGTLTLTPDVGQPALLATVGSGGQQIGIGQGVAGGTNGRLFANTAMEFDAGSNMVIPSRNNALTFGTSGIVWASLWSATGTIQTSSVTTKEGLTPLDPVACYQAAKDVRWYEFAYLPPAYQEPEPPPDIAYDAADDNETKAEKKALRDEAEAASKAAHLKMVAETAPARHQRGFVFPTGAEEKDEAGGALPPVPDLFGLSDRESTTPQADLATLGAAMQEIIRRLELLEVASGQAPAA